MMVMTGVVLMLQLQLQLLHPHLQLQVQWKVVMVMVMTGVALMLQLVPVLVLAPVHLCMVAPGCWTRHSEAPTTTPQMSGPRRSSVPSP